MPLSMTASAGPAVSAVASSSGAHRLILFVRARRCGGLGKRRRGVPFLLGENDLVESVDDLIGVEFQFLLQLPVDQGQLLLLDEESFQSGVQVGKLLPAVGDLLFDRGNLLVLLLLFLKESPRITADLFDVLFLASQSIDFILIETDQEVDRAVLFKNGALLKRPELIEGGLGVLLPLSSFSAMSPMPAEDFTARASSNIE